jgi:4-hydroxy-2-oxoheptanedioate aldolase
MITMGFRFVTVANDSGLMAQAARAAVNEVRKGAGAVAQ